MPRGMIMKALAGYYYVASREAPEAVVQCRARGIFKKRGESPLVGDIVEYSVSATGEGTVESYEPRSSELVRPPIANADQAVLVFAARSPALNIQLLDRFLVHVEQESLEPVICLTKSDLLQTGATSEKEILEAAEICRDIKRIYGAVGYRVIETSARIGEGMDAIREALRGRHSVFAGQSGVGKSSLLNALFPRLSLETNAISEKLGRGKHTTRHVELIPVPGGGFVADTPGFSSLEFPNLGAEQLGACFPEFAAFAEGCRFRGCLHVQEPACRVREAAEKGELAMSRYESYKTFLQEIKDRKPRY